MQVNPPLSEALFQYIWTLRLYNQHDLLSTAGERIVVLYPGLPHSHSGPDFKAAKIKIGAHQWMGNVELHLKTSDWFRHGHQHNPQYQQIILHVVFVHDIPAHRIGNVPCLELQQYIPKLLLQRYDQLRQSAPFVPCADHAGHIPSLIWLSWKERLLLERWQRKIYAMQAWLQCSNNNWDEVCYWAVAQSYGMPVNAMSFLQVAQSLPWPMLMRYRHQLFMLEALFFGQAGMLQQPFTDVYALQLQEVFAHLQRKYQLCPIKPYCWNWSGMRPAAFPTIRLATFAVLIQQDPHLFSHILDAKNTKELMQLFFVQPSAYWLTHYRFGHPVNKTLRPGKQAVHGILINTVLPLLFLYGQQKKLPGYQERALRFLQELPAEENNITANWKKLGISQENALDSQALLQLKQYYCDEKKCLQCAIGIKILRGI